MSLPQLTTDNDVEAICAYLKARPGGITITEAMTSMPRQLFDPQKINAYVVWGFVNKEGDHISLTDLGEDLINIAPGHKYLIYQKVIYNLAPYRAAVHWMFQKNFSEVTNIEVATEWQLHFKTELGTTDENQMKAMATCFMQICQTAGFGMLSSGKPSAMNKFSISKNALAKYFTETVLIMDKQAREAAAPPPAPAATAAPAPVPEVPSITTAGQAGAPAVERFDSFKERMVDMAGAAPSEKTCVYVSYSENQKLTEQIMTMLEVDKFPYKLGIKSPDIKAPLGEDVPATMKKCNSGIIFAAPDENVLLPNGQYAMSAASLIELGAAMALFGKNVVLLCDDRVALPQSIQHMDHFEFSGSELSWNAGVSLMKTVSKFRE
jgi:hypothetical protein